MVMKKIQWLASLLLINMPLFSMEQFNQYLLDDDDALMEKSGNKEEDDYTSTEEYSKEDQAYKFTADKLEQARKCIKQNVVEDNAAGLIELYFTQHKDKMFSKGEWISIVASACNYLPESEFFSNGQELKFKKFQLLLEGIIED